MAESIYADTPADKGVSEKLEVRKLSFKKKKRKRKLSFPSFLPRSDNFSAEESHCRLSVNLIQRLWTMKSQILPRNKPLQSKPEVPRLCLLLALSLILLLLLHLGGMQNSSLPSSLDPSMSVPR